MTMHNRKSDLQVYQRLHRLHPVVLVILLEIPHQHFLYPIGYHIPLRNAHFNVQYYCRQLYNCQ